MSKDKTLRAVQVSPITNGFVVNMQESGPTPATAPKMEQLYFPTAAEACQAAAEFLEPSVLHIVTGKKDPS